MKKIVPDPPLSPASPITIPAHMTAREALVCADTLLKDIYETTDAYRRMRPGRSAKSLDSVMDSTVVVATLVLHAIDRL